MNHKNKNDLGLLGKWLLAGPVFLAVNALLVHDRVTPIIAGWVGLGILLLCWGLARKRLSRRTG
ncbi:hypothetical protein GCM10027589_00070 [Actinocorallia lasiicapitis]